MAGRELRPATHALSATNLSNSKQSACHTGVQLKAKLAKLRTQLQEPSGKVGRTMPACCRVSACWLSRCCPGMQLPRGHQV